MDKRALIHQVIAIRELSDGILAQLAGEIVPASPACQHPANQREDLATFGSETPHWRCKACGYEHKEAPDGS